jgi:hypothetical protein
MHLDTNILIVGRSNEDADLGSRFEPVRNEFTRDRGKSEVGMLTYSAVLERDMLPWTCESAFCYDVSSLDRLL